jgi:hypothetical protein
VPNWSGTSRTVGILLNFEELKRMFDCLKNLNQSFRMIVLDIYRLRS